MLTAKNLLLKQTAKAFRGRADMSLMGTLEGATDAEGSWAPDRATPSIEQIVRHVAWAKSRFCQQGFSSAMALVDENVNGDGDSPDLPNQFPCGAAWGQTLSPNIRGAIQLLEDSQQILVRCLESCPDEKLEEPIPNHHGKTAAHFYWIMIMHDLYHAGQIRTRRTMFQIIPP